MGKIISLIAGAALIAGGIALLTLWRQEVLVILKAAAPGILILAGAIAVISGISEFIDTIKFSGKNK